MTIQGDTICIAGQLKVLSLFYQHNVNLFKGGYLAAFLFNISINLYIFFKMSRFKT